MTMESERFNAEYVKRQKAKSMRYKKPLCKEINLRKIVDDLYEWGETCGNLKWIDDEELEDALGGEEEAFEFKVAYSDLDYDIERAIDDIADWDGYISEYFDRFFVAIEAGNSDEYLGYDSYESDYFPLEDFDSDAAIKESAEKLKALTKDKLIGAAHDCFKLYHLYICLKYRMDCLDASISILKEKNGELLQTIKDIEKLYDGAEAESEHFRYETPETRRLDRLVETLPQEIWIQ